MPCELNRVAKIQLWTEDLGWLLKQPRTLERDHVECILRYQIQVWVAEDEKDFQEWKIQLDVQRKTKT